LIHIQQLLLKVLASHNKQEFSHDMLPFIVLYIWTMLTSAPGALVKQSKEVKFY